MSSRRLAVGLMLIALTAALPRCAHRAPAAASPPVTVEQDPPKATPSPPTSGQPEPARDPRLLEENVEAERIVETVAEAERLAQSVGDRDLTPPQKEQLRSIQSFLTQSREALANGEAVRAASLADKGLVLVRELEAASRP